MNGNLRRKERGSVILRHKERATDGKHIARGKEQSYKAKVVEDQDSFPFFFLIYLLLFLFFFPSSSSSFLLSSFFSSWKSQNHLLEGEVRILEIHPCPLLTLRNRCTAENISLWLLAFLYCCHCILFKSSSVSRTQVQLLRWAEESMYEIGRGRTVNYSQAAFQNTSS